MGKAPPFPLASILYRNKLGNHSSIPSLSNLLDRIIRCSISQVVPNGLDNVYAFQPRISALHVVCLPKEMDKVMIMNAIIIFCMLCGETLPEEPHECEECKGI